MVFTFFVQSEERISPYFAIFFRIICSHFFCSGAFALADSQVFFYGLDVGITHVIVGGIETVEGCVGVFGVIVGGYPVGALASLLDE